MTATEQNGNSNSHLWGAKAIGAEIKREPRQTLRLLEAGALPARKIGKLWVAERSKLRAFVSGEGAEQDA